ncbi:MAG: hypothetical protein H6581_31050 [Bacteroidia bacterium]|nr:hypothetical protein [Bacteroidia bacterium]
MKQYTILFLFLFKSLIVCGQLADTIDNKIIIKYESGKVHWVYPLNGNNQINGWAHEYSDSCQTLIAKIEFKKNSETGNKIYYFQSGQKSSVVKSNGNFSRFYPNGKKRMKRKAVRNGLGMVAKERFYFQSGHLEHKGQLLFVENNVKYKAICRYGTWKFFNEEGKLLRIWEFDGECNKIRDESFD